MNDLITIQNVKGYLDENGIAQLNLEDVSRGLGFTEEKNAVEYVRWRTVEGYLAGFGFSQEVAKDSFIPENIFYKLCFKASNETARAFQDLVTDEILPAIRKQGAYVAPTVLSPQLQVLINLEMQQKELKQQVDAATRKVADIRDIVAIHPNDDWRRDSAQLINKIAESKGSLVHIRSVRSEIYQLLETRFGVSLKKRLANKRHRMADAGISRTKRDLANYLDVIAEDKKLIEGYIAIAKEVAIKYGVAA